MTSITEIGTKGETSGVLIVDGFRITVGDEGDLTITNPDGATVNLCIGDIGFEDLSLNGDTLALLDEGYKGTDAKVYTLSLKELQNYAFRFRTLGESPTKPTISSFDLNGSGNLKGFTNKWGNNQGENNGYEGFTFFENGTKILAARQYSIKDDELSLDGEHGDTYYGKLTPEGYHDHIDVYNIDVDKSAASFSGSITLDNTQVRGDINSMRQTEEGNLLVMHGDASIKKHTEEGWENVNANGNQGVLRVQDGSELETTMAYYDLQLMEGNYFRNAEGIDSQRQGNETDGYSTEITLAFDSSNTKNGNAEERTYSTTVGGLNFDNDLRGAKEAIYLGSGGNDSIIGSSSRRAYIAGGDGSDTLTAKGDSLSKADILTGGLGEDTFCIKDGNQGVIWDFDATDKIEFDGMSFESIEAMEGFATDTFGFAYEEQIISIGGVDVETQMFTSDDSNSILYIANI